MQANLASTIKERRAWYLYDWANSAFATTVVTLFLGPYLTSLSKPAADAVGYLGRGLLLALNLVLYLKAEALGISEGMAVRISLCSAGVWWALFTIPAMLSLKNRGIIRSVPAGTSATGMAFRQLRSTFGEL